ncbi:hypothetical protein MKJ01_00275 [Chryseobacterium sp. SSA4.19]|uniref:hypothetical protein n=1 Tax=Chryseobacterium sp. SSA4.19 TaxID=2919915 RepID=UPI001F4DA78B|nr:hypothetical protein [Chryseobacterium sp. SSA4.19]MCJ8152195.1 hypothetical protein [Chryseobacterium sp. SSA4.19]
MNIDPTVMSTESQSKIEEYLQSVKDQISLVELDGYLPANAIIDAFNKGEEHGEAKFLSKFKDSFINNITQHFLYSWNIYNSLTEKKYPIDSCYISPVSRNTIYITSIENTVNDSFINLFYELAFDFEARFLKDNKSHLQFSFIGNEDVDYEQLACDHFIKVI